MTFKGTHYLGPLWLFSGGYFILNAAMLIFLPITDITRFGTEPSDPEGLLLGVCDASKPYDLDQNLNFIECFSPDVGLEANFRCGDPGDTNLLLVFDQSSGEVRCIGNPDKADEFAENNRIRELVLYSYIFMCAYGFALGFAMIIIGGKGLMKHAAWSYRSAFYLGTVMIAAGIICLAMVAGVIVPAISGGSESVKWYVVMLPAFIGQFLTQIALGLIAIIVLFRSNLVKHAK
jgi:hypothetical protein